MLISVGNTVSSCYMGGFSCVQVLQFFRLILAPVFWMSWQLSFLPSPVTNIHNWHPTVSGIMLENYTLDTATGMHLHINFPNCYILPRQSPYTFSSNKVLSLVSWILPLFHFYDWISTSYIFILSFPVDLIFKNSHWYPPHKAQIIF